MQYILIIGAILGLYRRYNLNREHMNRSRGAIRAWGRRGNNGNRRPQCDRKRLLPVNLCGDVNYIEMKG